MTQDAIIFFSIIYCIGAVLIPCAYSNDGIEVMLAAGLLWPLLLVRAVFRGARELWRS